LPLHSLFPYTTLFRSDDVRQPEGDLVGDRGRTLHRLGEVGEESCHLLCRLQVPLRVRQEPPSRFGEGEALLNAPQEVVERLALADRKSTRLNSSHQII